MLIAVLLTGVIFAQEKNTEPKKNVEGRNVEPRKRDQRNNRDNFQRKRTAPETVTIDGTLQLEKGFVAVSAAGEDSVYLVPKLTRYIGFIDGLKEGTKVSVEGFKFNKVIQPTKVTINGKSYEFAAKERTFANPGFGPGPKQQFRHNSRNNCFGHGRDFRPEPGRRGGSFRGR